MAPNALFCWEKSPLLVPVPVLPNRPVEVPVAAPNPNPVLVEEVAGWLNVLAPNRPPAEGTRTYLSNCDNKFIFLAVLFRQLMTTKCVGFGCLNPTFRRTKAE